MDFSRSWGLRAGMKGRTGRRLVGAWEREIHSGDEGVGGKAILFSVNHIHSVSCLKTSRAGAFTVLKGDRGSHKIDFSRSWGLHVWGRWDKPGRTGRSASGRWNFTQGVILSFVKSYS